MTNASITSIAKYLKYRETTHRKSSRYKELEGHTDPSSKKMPSTPNLSISDRYQKSKGTDIHAASEVRLDRQNQTALAVRDKDHQMQQIGRHLHSMRDALDTMIKHYPPYLHGSEQRNEVLEEVIALRKQIEQLTFASTTDHNIVTEPISRLESETTPPISASPTIANDSVLHRIPDLTTNANDDEITSSILQLNAADEFIQRQRNQLQTQAYVMFKDNDGTVDKASAEFSSKFIGKHLSHRPDVDLTVTPGILKEYLN